LSSERAANELKASNTVTVYWVNVVNVVNKNFIFLFLNPFIKINHRTLAVNIKI
jgi:hypothetical protein